MLTPFEDAQVILEALLAAPIPLTRALLFDVVRCALPGYDLIKLDRILHALEPYVRFTNRVQSLTLSKYGRVLIILHLQHFFLHREDASAAQVKPLRASKELPKARSRGDLEGMIPETEQDELAFSRTVSHTPGIPSSSATTSVRSCFHSLTLPFILAYRYV